MRASAFRPFPIPPPQAGEGGACGRTCRDGAVDPGGEVEMHRPRSALGLFPSRLRGRVREGGRVAGFCFVGYVR